MHSDRVLPTLEAIFRAVFERPEGFDVSSTRQLTEAKWDSVAHVSLIAAIESEFGVTIDIGDSLEMTSFEAIKLYLEALE